MLADAVAGDPRRGHPVALFGRAAAMLERGLYADAKTRGVVFTACCEALAIGPALAATRITRRRPLARLAWAGTVTWAAGARSLTAEAAGSTAPCWPHDPPGARQLRRTSPDNPAGRTRPRLRAVVELQGEHLRRDRCPLLWGALAGPPGLGLAYRAANTLDAMVGHHSPRYQQFGWASARLDDVVNWALAWVTARWWRPAPPSSAPDGRRSATALTMARHPVPNAALRGGCLRARPASSRGRRELRGPGRAGSIRRRAHRRSPPTSPAPAACAGP